MFIPVLRESASIHIDGKNSILNESAFYATSDLTKASNLSCDFRRRE